MRVHGRVTLIAPLVGAILVLLALSASGAQAAGFGVEKLFASNCKAAYPNCYLASTPAEELANAKIEGYVTAGGHPPYGVSDFTVANTGGVPNGIVKHIRFDSGPGESTNPEAVPKCPEAELGGGPLAAIGFYTAPTCNANTEIGTNKLTVYIEGVGDYPLEGKVYNAVAPTGYASLFVVAVELPKFLTEATIAKLESEHIIGVVPEPYKKLQYFAKTEIKGNVEWAGNYHDYYEIEVSPTLPLVKSRLSFKGNIGTGTAPYGSGGFLTNPTSCTGTGPQTTSSVTIESTTGQTASTSYTTPIGNEECSSVPYNPAFSVNPETTRSDAPDGITTELTVPHNLSPAGRDSSQTKVVSATLPEGLTLNPSAAAGLEACTPAQARITSHTAGMACPAASKVGTVTLYVPGLPENEPLTGNVYLGGPESGPITGPPYTTYVDAESTRYGVSVRLKGSITPNESTGQVTATFSENPEQPFSNLILHFNGGALAPIANPLGCGAATTTTSLTPFTENAAASPTSAFTVDSNGSGGSCASPLPVVVGQTNGNKAPANAGGNAAYSYKVERGEGGQYLSKLTTTLPPGLIGLIPQVPQCAEAQANAGTCSSASQIGTVNVSAGSGTPYNFTGKVYLTGPYQGAPFGLSLVVPAVAGPFNLGNVITRGQINVNQYTAQVSTTVTLPRVVKGIPLRLRTAVVELNREGFLKNPTNCGVLATEATLTGFVPGVSEGTTAKLSSPFQVGNCNKLAFKPKFVARSSANYSKANGASLETTINLASGSANFAGTLVQLPVQLPSRLTTLQKACLAKTFENNPYECPSGSFVGGARANTPTLPGKLTGPAILVSHANLAFPDLDLVLNANGVRIILVGHTNIKKGITTTNFSTVPDAPVTSITVNLPIGPHSALAPNGNLCASNLVEPTTLTAQNGAKIKQNTVIEVQGCPVRIVGQKTVGNTAYLTVQTYSPGRISGSGSGLKTVYRQLGSAQKTASLQVPRSGGTGPARVKVRVGFVPKKKGAKSSVAYTTVTFR